MNGFMNWLRAFGAKMRGAIQRFMYGRYGLDRLSTVMIYTGFGIFLVTLFFNLPILSLISNILMFWALFRILSKNTYKRYQENRKFSSILERLRDRQHRYFDCPKCRQSVRVPRGKGKIAITCPRCKERFIKKT